MNRKRSSTHKTVRTQSATTRKKPSFQGSRRAAVAIIHPQCPSGECFVSEPKSIRTGLNVRTPYSFDLKCGYERRTKGGNELGRAGFDGCLSRAGGPRGRGAGPG